MSFEGYFDEFEDRAWQECSQGTVRVAMVGIGWWTREFAIPAVEESTFCETTVAISSSREKVDRLVEDHETVQRGLTYQEFHDGEAVDAYDAVYICTPNALHLQYVETAMELGKGVLCEKPMESSVERAEQLVAASESSNTPLMVAYRMQTDPVAGRMQAAVEAGAIGDPVFVHANMTQTLLDIIEDPDQWRLNPELAGPGASVTDIGIYTINTTRFVLDRDPVAAQAVMHSEQDAFDTVPDERAAFQLSFEDGIYASCSASQNAALAGHLKVTGTEGEITLEPAFFANESRTLTLQRGDTVAEYSAGADGLGPAPDGVGQMREEFDYFADCILAGRHPSCDGEHGLSDMRTIEGIYESAERGERVEL